MRYQNLSHSSSAGRAPALYLCQESGRSWVQFPPVALLFSKLKIVIMGALGFLIGAILGWIGTSYIVGYLPVEVPCFYKFLFLCIIGPHILFALVIGYIVSKIVPL